MPVTINLVCMAKLMSSMDVVSVAVSSVGIGKTYIRDDKISGDSVGEGIWRSFLVFMLIVNLLISLFTLNKFWRKPLQLEGIVGLSTTVWIQCALVTSFPLSSVLAVLLNLPGNHCKDTQTLCCMIICFTSFKILSYFCLRNTLAKMKDLISLGSLYDAMF